MMVTIDRNIPAPNPVRRRQYPWHDLKIGDSFLALPGTYEATFRGKASKYAILLGFRITVSRTAKGLRAWRIAPDSSELAQER